MSWQASCFYLHEREGSAMDEVLNGIAERLLRQRTEIEQHINATTAAQNETAALLDRVQQLSDRLTPPQNSATRK
jgi:hypothetical protein